MELGEAKESGWYLLFQLVGPEGCIYEYSKYNLTIQVPGDYPFRPPKIIFNTKIYHPVFASGYICSCNIYELGDGWSPAMTIAFILQKIIEMMKFPDLY